MQRSEVIRETRTNTEVDFRRHEVDQLRIEINRLQQAIAKRNERIAELTSENATLRANYNRVYGVLFLGDKDAIT